MTVFGNKREYLPYYVYAITRLGNIGLGKARGKFKITSVQEILFPRGKREIYDPGKETLALEGRGVSIHDILAKKARQSRITLKTLTPLRLKMDGKLTRNPTVEQIVKSALFRLRVLSSLYSDETLDLLKDLDFGELLRHVTVESANFAWREVSRYSKRQETSMKLGGAMGNLTLSGNLERALPLLRVGQWTHVGKNTGFGLGRYELRPAPVEKKA